MTGLLSVLGSWYKDLDSGVIGSWARVLGSWVCHCGSMAPVPPLGFCRKVGVLVRGPGPLNLYPAPRTPIKCTSRTAHLRHWIEVIDTDWPDIKIDEITEKEWALIGKRSTRY